MDWKKRSKVSKCAANLCNVVQTRKQIVGGVNSTTEVVWTNYPYDFKQVRISKLSLSKIRYGTSCGTHEL